MNILIDTNNWLFWMWFAIYWSILGVVFDLFTRNIGWDKGYKQQKEAMIQTTKFLEKLAKKRGYKRIAKQAIQAIQETTTTPIEKKEVL